MNRLKHKKALVIGASTGIGRTVCELFAAEGADVAIADLNHGAERAKLLSILRSRGSGAFEIECDVTNREQVGAAVDGAAERFGQLDILVNNAGFGTAVSPFAEQDWELWDRVLSVNLNGVAFGIQCALKHMLPRGYGRIINTASQLAHKPAPGNAAYCAAKAGIVALSASVAQEVAMYGITVNCICPGPTDTPMWRASDEKWKEWKLSTLPIKRIGKPEEIAWAYVYLASDEAAYVIGQSISPNGGDVMW